MLYRIRWRLYYLENKEKILLKNEARRRAKRLETLA